MMKSKVGRTLRLHMGSNFMIPACWSMWVHRNRQVYSAALNTSHRKKEDTLGRSTATARRWADAIEHTGSPATCNGAESHIVRRDAGRQRSAAVSNERYASGDALLPSSPGGPLYDCDGFVVATYNFGDLGTSATGDVYCLNVVQRLLPGRAAVRRVAKLNCFLFIDCFLNISF